MSAGAVGERRRAAAIAVWCLCWSCGLLSAGAPGTDSASSRLGASLQEIQQRSPYKYVKDVIVAAEGETKVITCAFDSLYTAGKNWKRTFYSPVTWFSYLPGTRKSAAEEPITDGKVLNFDGGRVFAYKIMSPMSVVPSSLLVLENIPLQLSGTYFICKTNVQTGSVQAFYMKVVKSTLYKPSTIGGRVPSKLGESVRLNCQTANSFPRTSVYWSRQKVAATKWKPRKPVLSWGATYQLPSVTPAAAQFVYTCHVNNHLDPEWTADFRLDLINGTKAFALRPGVITATYNGVQPAFKAHSPRAAPQFGSSYTMSCRVQGEGSIRFSWLRNGSELKPYADPNLYTYSSAMGQQHFADLIVKSFRPSDRGTYECLASNDAGERRFKFDIKTVRSPAPSRPDESSSSSGGEPSLGGKVLDPQQSQQRLGSGWGSGDADPDSDADSPSPPSPAASSVALSAAPLSSGSSGDRRPPQMRLRRHRKRPAATSARPLTLP